MEVNDNRLQTIPHFSMFSLISEQESWNCTGIAAVEVKELRNIYLQHASTLQYNIQKSSGTSGWYNTTELQEA